MKYLRGCKIELLDIADDFYEAYLRCFEGKNHHQDEYGRIVSEIVAVPGFVNGLFASELYFKYLLGDKVNRIKGKDRHNLNILFNYLDDSIRSELLSIKIEDEYSLDKLLLNIGNGFIQWRYIFEEGNEKFGEHYPFLYTEKFLNLYLTAIKRICHECAKKENV